MDRKGSRDKLFNDFLKLGRPLGEGILPVGLSPSSNRNMEDFISTGFKGKKRLLDENVKEELKVPHPKRHRSVDVPDWDSIQEEESQDLTLDESSQDDELESESDNESEVDEEEFERKRQNLERAISDLARSNQDLEERVKALENEQKSLRTRVLLSKRCHLPHNHNSKDWVAWAPLMTALVSLLSIVSKQDVGKIIESSLFSTPHSSTSRAYPYPVCHSSFPLQRGCAKEKTESNGRKRAILFLLTLAAAAAYSSGHVHQGIAIGAGGREGDGEDDMG